MDYSCSSSTASARSSTKTSKVIQMDCYYCPHSAPSRAVMMAATAFKINLNLIGIEREKSRAFLKPKFRSLNPQHCLPTIDDNGFALWESRAIMIYFSDNYGKTDALYPKDPKTRAVIDQRLYFDKAVMFRNFTDEYYTQFVRGGKRGTDPYARRKIDEGFRCLDMFLEKNEYVAGNFMSLADISLAATLSSYEAGLYDYSMFKNVVRWYLDVPFTIPGWATNMYCANSLKDKLKGVVTDIDVP